MSSDTRRGRRGFKAVGTSYKLSLLSVVMTTLSVSISGAAVAQTTATPVARPSDDATNQSARERDRILLKRNPIASEYQGNDTPGRFFSAVTDAEGVDFRGQFRLPTGLADAHTAEIEANLSYQDVARDYTPGGSLKLAKGFDRWRLQFRAQKIAWSGLSIFMKPAGWPLKHQALKASRPYCWASLVTVRTVSIPPALTCNGVRIMYFLNRLSLVTKACRPTTTILPPATALNTRLVRGRLKAPYWIMMTPL